jgi:hypothetical protein
MEKARTAPIAAVADSDSRRDGRNAPARRCAADGVAGLTSRAMRDCPHLPHQ